MSKKIVASVLFSAALAGASSQLASAATVYDSGGFETPRFTLGTLTGQDGGVWVETGGSAAAGTAIVQTAVSLSGQAVRVDRLAGLAGGGNKRYLANLAPITPTAGSQGVVISWDMNVTQNMAAGYPFGPFFGMEAYDSAHVRLEGVGVDAHTGELLFFDPQTQSINITPADDTVSFGAWHHYQLALDYATHTAQFSVDGLLKVLITGNAGHPSGFQGETTLGTVTTFANADLAALGAQAEPPDETGTAFYDNYSIQSTVPEPTLLSAFAVAGLALLGRRRSQRQA